MTTQITIRSLNTIEYLPYLNEEGTITETLQKKIGVYGIFDENKGLKFVGYSRDIYASLKQHLIRQPDQCHWLKVEIINRPSRTILEVIKDNWIDEQGDISLKNKDYQALWTQPIDAKSTMTEEEQESYKNSDELTQIKLLKKVSRRVQG